MAEDTPAPTSATDKASLAIADRLIAVGIKGAGPVDSAAKVADEALSEAGGDVDRAIARLGREHTRLAAMEGFLTGFGGLLTLPVALPANVLAFFALAARNVAAVAKLRGYDISTPEVRSAVLMTLTGADARALMSKAGVVTTTGRVADLAAQRLPGPALMILHKGVGFHILSQFGQKGLARIVGRAVPVFGGVIGAGADAFLLRQIVAKAKSDFPLKAQFHPK